MNKRNLLREEDYWLIPLAMIGIVAWATVLFAGANSVQIPALIIGFLALLFVRFIIRKHYSSEAARVFMLLYVLIASVLSYMAFVLTN